jgi:hypothetical protein
MEMMQWDELPFSSGGSALQTEKRTWKVKLPVPLSSWSLRQTVCGTFSRSGWSVVRSASLTKGGTLKKRLSPHLHKFRLGVIRWVHGLFKWPSYQVCYSWVRGVRVSCDRLRIQKNVNKTKMKCWISLRKSWRVQGHSTVKQNNTYLGDIGRWLRRALSKRGL